MPDCRRNCAARKPTTDSAGVALPVRRQVAICNILNQRALTLLNAFRRVRRMKIVRFVLAVAAALVLSSTVAVSQEYTPLPFSVTLGGQAAQLKGNASEATVAMIEKPVAANAPLEVGAKGDMIIVNVVSANEKGTPVEGATPAIILIQGGNKTTLEKTMDGTKLAAGNYMMSVVAEGKSASVAFKIQ
jgi:hypothetical protein